MANPSNIVEPFLIEPVLNEEIVTRVACPACHAEKQFSVGHIIADHARGRSSSYGYTWLCDNCHHEIRFEFNEEGKLLCGPNGFRRDYDFVVLEITPENLKNTGRVLLVDSGLRDQGGKVKSTDTHPSQANPRDHDYFFTEHSCNINTLRHLDEIIVIDTETGEIHNDPHSLFTVVGAVPWHKYKTAKGHLDFDNPRPEDLKTFLVDAEVLPREMSTKERGDWIERNIPLLREGQVIRLGDLTARKERKPGAPIYTLERGRNEDYVYSDVSAGALLDAMILYYTNPNGGSK